LDKRWANITQERGERSEEGGGRREDLKEGEKREREQTDGDSVFVSN
jgi:hypothetical protein